MVTEQELSNTPERIIARINGQLPPPYPGRDGVYTTAVWNNTEDVPLIFVVGDGEVTVSPDGTEYINKRLSECTTYGVFYYITLQLNNGHEVEYCNRCIIDSLSPHPDKNMLRQLLNLVP